MSKFSRIIAVILLISTVMSCMVFSPVAAQEVVTVTFDANGGTGAPAPINLFKGGTADFTQPEPTRDGMVFVGWCLSPEYAYNGVLTYLKGSTGNVINQSVTLYAAWAYMVSLNCGSEGWGNTSYMLFKFPGRDLDLYHHKSDICANYAMLPGVSGNASDDRVFIEWNNVQNADGKGIGYSFHEKYTMNSSTILYAIWGYPVVYGADGGTYPSTKSDRVEEYVTSYDPEGLNSKSIYGNFDFPEGIFVPKKEGCRLVTANGTMAYMLLNSDKTIARYETAKTGLTEPTVVNGEINWNKYVTTATTYGECAIELYPAWEPSVTYNANGGEGNDVVEYMTYVGGKLYGYADYTVAQNSFTHTYGSFLSWNTKADGTGTSYGAGDVITNYGSSDPLTLYAQWSEHEHSYTSKVTKESTCSLEGETTYTCECGSVYTEEIAKKDHIPANPVVSVAPTCVENGEKTVNCKICSEFMYTELAPAVGHSYSGWNTTVAPTTTTEGERTKTCAECGDVVTEVIATLSPENCKISVDNFTVFIDSADILSHIRYASGVHTTADSIKNAEDCVNINSAVIAQNTLEGVYSRTLSTGGTYSFWLKFDDGTTVIRRVDLENFTPTVTADGVTLTVHNLYNIRDLFIAKGNYDTFEAIKNNYIVRRTAEYLNGAKSYQYIVTNPGLHTVLVRYDDGSYDVCKISLSVNEPIFATDGLRVKIDNLKGVQVVRMILGTYTTDESVKSAQGCWNLTNKSVIKNAPSYTLQFGNDGPVTIVVKYTNGYIVVKNLTLEKKTPAYTVDGADISFTNLNDMTALRYVKGVYETENEVKSAPGNSFVRASDIKDGAYTLTVNEVGEYTFVVRYNDTSTNIIHITIDSLVPQPPEAPAPELASGVSVSHAFSDNMILQRDEKISVWGWAPESENGKSVKVNFKGETLYATVANGEWKAVLENTYPADTKGATLTVEAADNTYSFNDILMGDVYYAIGQSNIHYSMLELDVDNRAHGNLVAFDFDDNRNIRFFRNSNVYHMYNTGDRAPGTATLYKDAETPNGWQTPSEIGADFFANYPTDIYTFYNRTDGSCNVFSAIGYMFAYNMSNRTDIPVGVIEIDASGFPLIAFAPNELAEKWGDEVYDVNDGTYHYGLTNATFAGTYYPLFQNTLTHSRMAYNQQLYPLINFSTAGIIWYQGESDWLNTEESRGFVEDTFKDQFTELMTYYREHMGNSDFAVYMIEYAPNYPESNSYIPFGFVRTELGCVPQMLEDSYLVSSSDTWEDHYWYNNVHPYIKHLQAARLTDVVLGHQRYADQEAHTDLNYASGPVLAGVTYSANTCVLAFNYFGDGLKTSDGLTVRGLEIQVNGVWYAADNVIISGGLVGIGTTLGNITGVRYNCTTESFFGEEVTLCNSAGVPAVAFVDYNV